MKVIIFLPLTNSARTPPQGRFIRSVELDKHIWDGREYDLDEWKDVDDFNATVDKALAFYPGRLPRPAVRIIDDKPAILPSHLQTPIEPKPRKPKTTKRSNDFATTN